MNDEQRNQEAAEKVSRLRLKLSQAFQTNSKRITPSYN
ncbi:Protein of unknown function [Pyronema omphalodes CBS 100304]|uniref:Uncharacterized protein n=1 Tax=Pyronema omphalodes (strain CBS 100304) TaxID=1076935 RepID=U4LB70_PYROM|nr:Protein of unknown function [Pyronema omphalodes CBS 100304]